MTDRGSSSGGNPISDSDIIANTNLSTKDDSVAKSGRASDARLSGDKAVLADTYIMSDADKIINLCAPADNGEAKLSPVDASSRSNLNVICDADGA